MKCLNFDAKYKDKLKKGEKRATLRLGIRKDFKEGEVVMIRAGDENIGLARITKIRYLKWKEVGEKEIREDGYKSKKALKRAMKKFYGDIADETSITQICFEFLDKGL